MSAHKLPYRLERLIQQLTACYFFTGAKLSAVFASRRASKKTVWVVMGYQGASGGTEAICAVASSLTENYAVTCNLDMFAPANRWMSHRVGRGFSPTEPPHLVICDRAADLEAVSLSDAVPVLCSVHGGLKTLHGLEQNVHLRAINRANIVHFVSTPQSAEFEAITDRRIVIPNFIPDFFSGQLLADEREFDVGMVGYFARPEKNLPAMLSVMDGFTDRQAVIWGSLPEGIQVPGNVTAKGISSDKVEIFSSMSVLLALSRQENLPLVVIQALCAGVPCVLSDIPAHREIHNAIGEGITIVDAKDTGEIRKSIEEACAMPAEKRLRIRETWRETYSEAAVMPRWVNHIAKLIDSNNSLDEQPPLRTNQ